MSCIYFIKIDCCLLFHACLSGGTPPTDVTAEQTGVSTVLVTWTAPSPPPTDEYQVQITRGSTTTTVNVAGTSHTFSVNNQYGVYSIQVRSPPSQHFQSNEAAPEPVEITVRGKHSVDLTHKCMNYPASHIYQLMQGQIQFKWGS